MTSPSGSKFVPISPNPYIVGNPIRDPAMFFGREAEFELIRKRFKDSPDEGGLLVFCGERRSGKTSILFQILAGRLGEDFIPVLIDMQSMAIEDEVGFLQKITDEIFAQLGSAATRLAEPDFHRGGQPSAVFQKFVDAVLSQYPKKKLILLIDEYELLESKIDAGILSEDVLLILAYLMEKQSVYIVFTGSVNIGQRNREYWHRFLAKSAYRQISYLHPKDAHRLITEPVKGRAHYEKGVVESIYRSSAGQAFYTQGICQGLVDYMNERQTNRATEEDLEKVIKGIIDNPFPQMRFHWDGLSEDEKLVLSLLAESLGNADDYASAETVHRLISKSKYPLDLGFPRISAVLESLFESEMLLKNHDAQPGFAFRMDLWRRWVVRMHSVWAVMRDLGLKLRARRSVRIPLLVMAAAAIVLAIVVLSRGSGTGEDVVARVPLDINVAQAEARIVVDDQYRGSGSLSDSLAPGHHDFLIACTGYRDSMFSAELVSNELFDRFIDLEPLMGSARIRSKPEGAELWVNGTAWGRSPKVIPNLEVPKLHSLKAQLDGYHSSDLEFRVRAETETTIVAVLEIKTIDLEVRTAPSGAMVSMDEKPLGVSPRPVPGLALGAVHTFRAEMTDYHPITQKVKIKAGMRPLILTLEREPLGYLIITGEKPANMKIPGKPVLFGEWSSGIQSMKKGDYEIEVTPESEEPISRVITVRSGYKVTYNYSSGEVTYETWTGESE